MEAAARQQWASRLGISREAIDLYLSSDVIDLHIDTFIWTRIFNYDLTKRHGTGPTRACFAGQVDLPRIREAQVTGGMWSVTTQPFRSAKARSENAVKNFDRIRKIFAGAQDKAHLCHNVQEYQDAKKAGKHAVFLSIQGGNALGDSTERCEATLDQIKNDLMRVTLVHLSTSSLGCTSAPSAGLLKVTGLTDYGREYVQRLNAAKIFVDLAHISREGFFHAVEMHDKSQPLIVTHTGVKGVHDHWRNLDNEQIRVIASTGGTIGVMYQSSFLGDPWFSGKAESIVKHLEHIIKVGGEHSASLGSDWDGMIVPPADMRTCLELPKLVQIMLNRGWKPECVQNVLGRNFLRTLKSLRG
ncbi:MAG: membrane dipeptidase [Bdellovibrionales bacterium]|nr:membrane dipeptidase [Bdellovibrionales bacterium]